MSAVAAAAAVIAVGGIGAIKDAHGAPAAPHGDPVARLTKRVTSLEHQVSLLRQTVQHICENQQLVSHVSADPNGTVNVQYVRCTW